ARARVRLADRTPRLPDRERAHRTPKLQPPLRSGLTQQLDVDAMGLGRRVVEAGAGPNPHAGDRTLVPSVRVVERALDERTGGRRGRPVGGPGAEGGRHDEVVVPLALSHPEVQLLAPADRVAAERRLAPELGRRAILGRLGLTVHLEAPAVHRREQAEAEPAL